MIKRVLGSSELALSVIGLGTWAIGGAGWSYGWGRQEEKDSLAVIIEALEQGINWIDTAPVYGVGKSETIVGKAIKEWKDEVYIATKCGLYVNLDNSITPCLKKESIIKECESSLKRLDIGTIDLYQIHWPHPEADIEEAYEAMLMLKSSGKVRFVGVSNFNISQLERVALYGGLTSLQPPYSLLRREIEEQELPWCAKNKVGVISYSPLQSGILTGKVTKDWVAALPKDDWRKNRLEYIKPDRLSETMKIVDDLSQIAKQSGHTISQLAVAWVLRRKEIVSAIVGARKKGQIKELVAAAQWNIDSNTLACLSHYLLTISG